MRYRLRLERVIGAPRLVLGDEAERLQTVLGTDSRPALEDGARAIPHGWLEHLSEHSRPKCLQ